MEEQDCEESCGSAIPIIPQEPKDALVCQTAGFVENQGPTNQGVLGGKRNHFMSEHSDDCANSTPSPFLRPLDS